MIKTSENSCTGIGGYRQPTGKENEIPSEEIFSCEFLMTEGVVHSILNFHSKALNSGPVAHNFILNSPTDDCFLVAGGTQERWAVLSKNVLPADPCDLVSVGKCRINLHPTEETVRWIGCDGPCKRWFHSEVCLKMALDEAKSAEKMKNWYCRRPDCKK